MADERKPRGYHSWNQSKQEEYDTARMDLAKVKADQASQAERLKKEQSLNASLIQKGKESEAQRKADLVKQKEEIEKSREKVYQKWLKVPMTQEEILELEDLERMASDPRGQMPIECSHRLSKLRKKKAYQEEISNSSKTVKGKDKK